MVTAHETETRHLVIHGRVQGVGFRCAMVAQADRLGLSGWVRNCRNGTVEAIISGSAQALAGMLVWARHGPALARVDHLAVSLPAAAQRDELAALFSGRQFVQRATHD